MPAAPGQQHAEIDRAEDDHDENVQPGVLEAGVAEQSEFEEVVRKIVAARVVLHRLSEKLFAPLRVTALRAQVLATRDKMKKTQLSPTITAAVREYFSNVRELLREANALAMEVEQMVLGVQRRFAEELGWSLSPPMPFSLDTYIAELERA